MKTRSIIQTSRSQATLEGAGVHLQRAFGFGEVPDLFDPFLLLDDFRSDDPAHYRKPASRGTRTAASRPSPTCWTARWSTATAWATRA